MVKIIPCFKNHCYHSTHCVKNKKSVKVILAVRRPHLEMGNHSDVSNLPIGADGLEVHGSSSRFLKRSTCPLTGLNAGNLPYANMVSCVRCLATSKRWVPAMGLHRVAIRAGPLRWDSGNL